MNRNKTVAVALQEGKAALRTAGKPPQDAVQLLMQLLQMSRVKLLTQGERLLTDAQAAQYSQLLQQRTAGYPLQYMLGQCEFMGLSFSVGEGVLIPRSDTETLVETVLEVADREGLVSVLDIGTGSGCIPISLAHYGGMQATGVDISPQALGYAQENAAKNGVEIEWIQSDLFSALPKEKKGRLDAIVSNPPYICAGVIATLMPEVRDFEPRNALDGGADGLDFYRAITTQSRDWLRNGGWLFFEIGYDQGAAVLQLLQENGFCDCALRQDLSGLDRVVWGRMVY